METQGKQCKNFFPYYIKSGIVRIVLYLASRRRQHVKYCLLNLTLARLTKFILQTRIVGGHETGINEFPLMAALLDPGSGDLLCGASIISNRYALTAAHCLLHKTPNNLGLLVGDHDITTGSSSTMSTQLYHRLRLIFQ